MQNIRATISLPSHLVKELKKVEKLEQCSSFSDLMRHIVTSYLEERRKIKMLQEMEEQYKEHAHVLHKSAKEHATVRTALTDEIFS